jgi:hypothetical protein
MKLLRLIIFLLIIPFGLQSQSFEGKIVYTISYNELPPEALDTLIEFAHFLQARQR